MSGMSSSQRHSSAPPVRPMQSAITVSSGSAITSPMTRGTTSTSYGSTPVAFERIHFLVELHRADLGGERAARAAGDDDRGEQHAELAQHADGDEVDHEDLGAELLQLLRAHVRDDHADQERDQRDDGNRGDAGVVDMPRDGGRPQALAARECAAQRDDDAPEKREARARIAPAAHDLAAERLDGLHHFRLVVLARVWRMTRRLSFTHLRRFLFRR